METLKSSTARTPEQTTEQLPRKSDGDGYEIELVGEIANMVALANGISLESKKVISNQTDLNTYHSSVKLVAGACNTLYRTRITWPHSTKSNSIA